MIPEVGKKYKHYKGGIYTVANIENETVTAMKANSVYRIGLDMWNTPAAISNGCSAERFTKNKRKRK